LDIPTPIPLPLHSPVDDDDEDILQDDTHPPNDLPLFLSGDEPEFGDNRVIDEELDDDIDDGENEEAEEEIISSMMTGGRFTREQVLEVKDLAKTFATTLEQRAKAWKQPLDTVMRIANLVIATKERWAGGNAWNAYQSAFHEDPDKATRKYFFVSIPKHGF
jgi:hypothetical protein